MKQIDRAVRINGSRERNERSMTNGMTGPNAMADMNRTAGTNGGAGANGAGTNGADAGAHARAGSGRQIRISGGGYTAEIASVGATLRSLSHRDRPLTATFGADEVRPAALGTGLLPWPNRIAGGAYEFAGRSEQLPITEPERGNAIHGLASWLDWDVVGVAADRVELATRIAAQPGYPHSLEAMARLRLGAGGLRWSITTTNVGSAPAPYGVATHPYLRLPTGRADQWRLRVPAHEVLDVDEDTKLPRRLHPVAEFADGAFDFTSARPIGPQRIDHAMTGIEAEGGTTGVELFGPDAADSGVSLSWDPEALPWVQIFTADVPDHPELDRRAVAVEAMTCPPDAFNSGTDLLVLDPGETHEATWTIAAIGEVS